MFNHHMKWQKRAGIGPVTSISLRWKVVLREIHVIEVAHGVVRDAHVRSKRLASDAIHEADRGIAAHIFRRIDVSSVAHIVVRGHQSAFAAKRAPEASRGQAP